MTTRVGSRGISLNFILLVIAIILFILAALGFDVKQINLEALGLAFFAGSFLVT